MITVFLSPLYLLVNLYILQWILRWLGACHEVFGRRGIRIAVSVVYAFFALALLAGFLLPIGSAKRVMQLIGNYWLGVFLYLVLAVAIADALRLILIKWGRLSCVTSCSRWMFVCVGGACALIVAGVSIWGAINARIVRTTDYEVTVDKDGGRLDSLRVVLLADLHLGYNIGCGQMERMVEAVNAVSPDLVVVAGDIFDNEYEALEDEDRLVSILRGIRSRYGVYACYGNHDIAERIIAGFTFGGNSGRKVSDPRMDAFMERAGFQLLRDEYVLIDDSFYLYGRPDAERPGRGIDERKTPEEITAGLDFEKPVLVMDHEPRELQELADAGVDVDLCGHTHDGQLFPGNLTIDLMWENACGYLRKDRMHNIVTSGVGLFGPNMRVGTIAEICDITIHFR